MLQSLYVILSLLLILTCLAVTYSKLFSYSCHSNLLVKWNSTLWHYCGVSFLVLLWWSTLDILALVHTLSLYFSLPPPPTPHPSFLLLPRWNFLLVGKNNKRKGIIGRIISSTLSQKRKKVESKDIELVYHGIWDMYVVLGRKKRFKTGPFECSDLGTKLKEGMSEGGIWY